jgi:heat shock protein HslJ
MNVNPFNARMWIRLMSLALIVVVALAACAPAATPTPVPTPVPTPTPSNTITDIPWQWASVTDKTTSQTTYVPKPADYTITFKTDGTLTGKADCNSFSGTYSTASGFSIKLGPSTMASCGENSLDQQYLQLLSSVAAGGPNGSGGLALETAGGAQRMEFKNGNASLQ